MKTLIQLCATVWLFILFTTRGECVQRVHCQWGPFGSWSECNPCTKSQTRSRAMAVYAQFGGNRCDGGRNETKSCETTQGCPLEDGCGYRFRCQSGKCVSKSLLCNGDQDCEGDGLDERVCDSNKHVTDTCDVALATPPNIELIGLGFDVVTGETRVSVINTQSFGGQCRPVFSGINKRRYRLPLNAIRYTFLAKAQNDFSDEMFTSEWHYAKDIVNRETVTGTTTGYHNYDFHKSHDTTQTHRLVVLKNEVEVVQFQSNSPKYLTISEEFWKELAKLPLVYDYSAYRKILEKFGTHYISEGSLGGFFKSILAIDQETERKMESEVTQFEECERTKRWFLFFPITTVTCKKGHDGFIHRDAPGGIQLEDPHKNKVVKVDVEGGGVTHIEALKGIQLEDPHKNWEMYSNWADSIQSFPKVIKQKLRLLSELVKEVQCTGVKKLYLRRAIEQYLEEGDVCHCQPCRNNGLAVRDGDECKCICKPGTSNLACELGTDVEGQQGVINGRWSCWSAWSSCSGGRRSRIRSCSNPSPQNGGQHCIGDVIKTSGCDDAEELQYLKTMEPQCFDVSLPEPQKCDTPPSLINGYILNPKDNYFVGDRVEYACTSGFDFLGNILECTPNHIWSGSPGLCAVSACKLPLLTEDIIVFPLQAAYHLGETVFLSCPEGKELQGEKSSTCDSSLHFSPDPAEVRCIQADKQQKPTEPKVQCQPWEKPFRGNCVCKMPFECSSSLELCATIPVSRRFVPVTVCKMHALQCKGTKLVIAEYNSCTWPQRNTTGCSGCHMWEDCDDQNNECRCKDSANCSTPGSDVCVRVGEDVTVAPQTMNECEAGLRRCKGENVSVISTMSCS